MLVTINQRGKLNCIYSDGRRLLGYRDREWTKGLAMRSVTVTQNRTHRIEDATIKVDLHDENVWHGVIVATRPLDDEPWHALRPQELIVVCDGRIEFSSHRSRAQAAG